MILTEKLEKPYKEYTIRSMVWIQCDYCGKHFQRDKKTRERLNVKVPKDGCGDKACTASKKEEAYLAKYGVKNIFQATSFKENLKEKNIAKHGTDQYLSSEEFKTKRRATLINKFGVDSPLRDPTIQRKQQQTCLDRYGVANYFNMPGFVEQRAASNLEKYGHEHVMQVQEISEKRDKTCEERFDVKNYTQTPEYWKQRKATCLDRYGVEHPSQIEENREKARQTNLARYAVENYAQTEEFRERYAKTCMEKYGVPNPLCLQDNQRYGKTQRLIQEWCNSMGLDFKSDDYTKLLDQEIDLYEGSLHIGIEYCGLFWHNELSPQPRLKHYHYEKYLKCLSNGIRLITIFEDEWKNRQEQCKGFLRSVIGKNETRLYARNCQVLECDRQEFNVSCNQYHIQGSNNLGTIFYVLKHNGEIVAGMSLGRHHRGNPVLVLDRLFFKYNTQVIGGASRLFDRCVNWAKDNQYEKIVSWSDNRWSQGDIYKKLGFTMEKDIPPDYSYVNPKKPCKRLSKQSQKKANTGCSPDKTERQWALEKGLARIWDCGKKRWSFLV